MIFLGRTKRLVLLVVFAGLCFASGTSSLRPSAASQEAVQLQKPLQYQVSVTLKLVQVYVTDKKGKPVQDLQKSDFVVYDNGQKKEITEFEKHILTKPAAKAEVQAAEEKIVPTPLPPADQVSVMNRKFFLFFDFAFNNQKGVNKAKEAALHFIDSELSPGDQVGLLSYSMLKGLSIHEYLTSNHRNVREAIKRLNAKDIAGRAEDIEEEYWRMGGGGRDVYQKSPSQLMAERQESINQAQNFFIRMTALAKALRYIPGKKHLILFSTGVPSSLLYGNRMTPTKIGPKGSIQSVFNLGEISLIAQNEEMLKELSTANCTIFTFDTREAAMVPSIFEYDKQTFEEHNRDSLSPLASNFAGAGLSKDDNITGWYSISRISSSTGGKYFSNINEYVKNLEQVQTITGTYYVLGYYISDLKDGAYHQIKVEVARKGCEVRAQTGYFNPKPFREYSDLEKELHLFDLALTERPLLQTPLIFTMAPLTYITGEETRLQVLSKIPEAVIKKFSGKKVELVSLIFDEKENLASLQRVEADLTKYRGMDVFYASGATLPPGQYKCRLVIRDLDTGDAAVASAMANVGARPVSGLSLHSPLLLVQESSFAYLEGVGAKKEEAISWKEIYSYDKSQYSPIIGEAPTGTAKLQALVPCSVKEIFLPNISLTAHLINSASGAKIPVALAVLSKSRKGDVEVQFVEFPLNDIPPGRYSLYFYAEEAGTKFISYSRVPITIQKETTYHLNKKQRFSCRFHCIGTDKNQKNATYFIRNYFAHHPIAAAAGRGGQAAEAGA